MGIPPFSCSGLSSLGNLDSFIGQRLGCADSDGQVLSQWERSSGQSIRAGGKKLERSPGKSHSQQPGKSTSGIYANDTILPHNKPRDRLPPEAPPDAQAPLHRKY